MANRIIYRSQAEEYLTTYGWKLFLDMMIKDNAIILNDPSKKIVINVTDDNPVIIKRKGLTVYEDE